MLPQEIIHGLSFDPKDPLWKAVHALLDASIDSEVASAISKENKGEDRAWYAGRADALTTFKEILVNTRNDVLRDQGKPPEDYVS
jgi:hypothetical protein